MKARSAHDGADPERLGGRDDPDVEPEGARPAHAAPEALEHRAARGEPEAPDRPPARGLADLGRDLPVEPDAVVHEAHVGG